MIYYTIEIPFEGSQYMLYYGAISRTTGFIEPQEILKLKIY